MAETPKKPNMSPPSKPAGKTGSQGNFNELTKTLRDIRDMQAADMKERKDDDVFQRKLMVAEQVEQLHMIGIMKKVEKNIEKNTERIEKKFDEDAKRQTEQNKLAKEQLKKSSGSSESSEDEKEGKDEEKKRWKAFADSIKKGFGVGVDKGKGFFKGLWDMITKFKTVLLVLGLGTLLANIKVGDLKKTWIKVKDFFKATKEFLTPIAEWGKDYFFPATMTLFFETMDNLKILFDNLTKDFKGFMSKGWIGKTEAIFLALADIGHFVGSFLGSVLNWTMQLLGYDGEITKDIKNWMSTHFGPEISHSITTLFTTVVGGFAIMRVLGMSPIAFISKSSAFLFSSIAKLFAVVRLALSPVGLGITAAALAVIYNRRITDAVETALDNVTNWFTNLPAIVNNVLIGTGIGKLFGLTKMKVWDHASDDKQKAYDNQLEKREAAKVELARLQEWKRMSATPGPRGLADLQQAGFDGRLEDADLKINIQKHEIKKWDAMAKNWKDYYGESLAKTNFDITDKPKTKPDITLRISPPSNTVLDQALESGANVFSKLLGRDMGKHEGFVASAKPDAGGLSIGHGFHLSKKNAADVLKKADISKSLEDLMSGKETITRDEAKRLVDVERGFFTNVSKKWIGEDHWAKMNFGQRQALFDMSYNMGAGFYKEGTWPDLKRAIIANDDKGIRDGVMLNKKGDGPSQYSLDVGASRYQANIMALQKDGIDLAPAMRPPPAGNSPSVVSYVDQSNKSESLFNSKGKSYDSDRSGAREFFMGS